MNSASPWRSLALAPWQHVREPEPERAAVRLGPRPEAPPPPLGALPAGAATLARWQEWRASTETRRETLVRTGQLAPAQAAALARLEANRERAGSATEPGWAQRILDGLYVPEGRDARRTLALLVDACGGRVEGLLAQGRLAAVEAALERYLRPLWQAAREAEEGAGFKPARTPWREERPAAETEPAAATGEEREESEMMAGAAVERPVKKWPCSPGTMAEIALQVARRGGFGLPKSEREDAARDLGLTPSTFDVCYYALRRDPDGYAALLAETEPAPPTERPEHVPLPEAPAPVVEPEAEAMNPCGHPVAAVTTGAEGTQYCAGCESEAGEEAAAISLLERLAAVGDKLTEALNDRDSWRNLCHLRTRERDELRDLVQRREALHAKALADRDTLRDAGHVDVARERDELRERVTELERAAGNLRAEHAIHRIEALQREAGLEHDVEKLCEERDRLQQRVTELLGTLQTQAAAFNDVYSLDEHVYTLTGRELQMAYHVAEAVEAALLDRHQVWAVPASVWRAAGEMLVLVDGDGEGGAS